MPELPEVETIRTQLEPKIIDRRVISADSHESLKFLAARQIVGRHFLGLRRRGKYLIAELDGSTEMVVHLGMTGKFFLLNKFYYITQFDLTFFNYSCCNTSMTSHCVVTA